MRKATMIILAAMMIILTAVPAFAYPVLLCGRCSGHMCTTKVEEKQASDSIALTSNVVWDQARDVLIFYIYKNIPMEKNTYLVCDQNSYHKELIKTEYYTKVVLDSKEEYQLSPN